MYFTLGYGINKIPIYYYSEFYNDRCVKVLYTKKDKFATKIAYVQNIKKKNHPCPKNFTQALL